MKAPGALTIEPLDIAHHAPLLDIYNHYVEATHVTFDVEPYTADTRSPWYEQFDGQRWQCLVGRFDGRVAGYACTTRFRPKPAYVTSAEVSVYLHPDFIGRGLGTALYEALFARLPGQGLHRAYACIALPNEASIALHRRFGFEHAGHLREVGWKFDRYWDVVYLERALG
jgi:phosphinothricin acetyltransferase